MEGKTIVVLGGGFGGLSVAHELRERIPPENRIIIIDRKKEFMMGFSNLWILSGERDPAVGKRELSCLQNKGIEYLNEEIISVEPKKKIVRTETKEIYANYIIISLGADLAPEKVPGFEENAYDFYSYEGAIELRNALEDFKAGKIAILVASLPFKCPVAPYEAAMLIHSFLEEKGLRKEASIDLYTPEDSPVAFGKKEIGNALKKMLSEREIGYHPGHRIKEIDGEEKKLVFDGKEYSYDIIAGVPAHKLPKVIEKAGMSDETGWIPVDPGNSETVFPGVFAIGDVTSVKIGDNAFLPKSAVFAEGEAVAVAEKISSELKGKETDFSYSGYGYCFVETGHGENAPVHGNFYAIHGPELKIEDPNRKNHEKMVEFEAKRLKKWFE